MNRQQADPTLTKAHPTLAEDDLREPTKEEILEDIRIGLRDVLAGHRGQDAMEFLDELEREAMVDAN